MNAAWGNPEDDADVRDGAFRFRATRFGNVLVALPPDRGRSTTGAPLITIRACRRATHCLPSGSGFGITVMTDAMVHMGAHGTLEWLPGKAVALTPSCFPEIVDRRAAGDLSLPGQSNPGEAAQAKRRIAAHDHRPSAAAAGASQLSPARRRSSSGWSTNMPSPTGSTVDGGCGWRG